MRIFRNFLGLFLLTAFIFSCVDENESNADFVGTISEPTNISALVSITQDNTGLVTITPTGEVRVLLPSMLIMVMVQTFQGQLTLVTVLSIFTQKVHMKQQ